MDGSENDSMEEEEYTTALPAFTAKEGKEKDRKDHGFRVILPFQRKRKDKDKDKDKDKGKEFDQGTDRREKEIRGGPGLSALGETGGLKSIVSGRRESQWENRRGRDEKNERDDEF